MNRRDPRIQQTIDRITTTLETANAATQTSVYDFSSRYLNPCIESISECFFSTCAPCANAARERARARQRAFLRSQRPEAVFDFYADWDDDPYDYDEDASRAGDGVRGSSSGHANERTGLLSGWGADELDRLLAGRPKEDQQPRRQKGMTYGTTRKIARRGSAKGVAGTAKDELDDPNVVPASSKFGFLERLPFKIGPRGLRYKPSAANMQEGVLHRRAAGEDIGEEEEEEHEGQSRDYTRQRTEGDALLDDSDGDDGIGRRSRRNRSGTIDSGNTDTSYSSRGDLFPSDDEDDAVMIDDEMALVLGRRNTDDLENPSIRSGSMGRKRSSNSRRTSLAGSAARSRSSKSLASKGRSFSGDSIALASPTILESPEPLLLPTMEEQVRQEEAGLEEGAEIDDELMQMESMRQGDDVISNTQAAEGAVAATSSNALASTQEAQEAREVTSTETPTQAPEQSSQMASQDDSPAKSTNA